MTKKKQMGVRYFTEKEDGKWKMEGEHKK